MRWQKKGSVGIGLACVYGSLILRLLHRKVYIQVFALLNNSHGPSSSGFLEVFLWYWWWFSFGLVFPQEQKLTIFIPLQYFSYIIFCEVSHGAR